jgi:hypothetical protein
MSARNPLHILKSQIDRSANKAYHVKNLRGSDAINNAVLDDIEVLLDPSFIRELKLFGIGTMVGNRFEELVSVHEQLDFFRDLDFQITFGRGQQTYNRTLGDLDYRHAMLARQRKVANLERANTGLARFDRAFGYVGPLLKDNPDWVWRDAVRHLEENGGIPDWHDDD